MLSFTGVTLLSWIAIETSTSMYAWSAAFGLGAGAVSSLLQAGITTLNEEPRKTGVKIGMAFTAVGFASLVGGPVGGRLLEAGERAFPEDIFKAFMPMIAFMGCIMMVGCGILVVMRATKAKGKFRTKI